MKYDQFTSISSPLKLQIIRKCYPIPYVRLRQTCHFMDEFCEDNQKYLGIYIYQKEPHLYLLYSALYSPFSKLLDYKGSDFKEPRLMINYGNQKDSHNFMVPMTVENVPRIRRMLSGFTFTHLTINYHHKNFGREESFDTVIPFLQVVRDFPVIYLHMFLLPIEHIEMFVDTWNPEILSFHCLTNGWEVLQLDKVKKVDSLTFIFMDENASLKYDRNEIRRAIQDKKHGNFKANFKICPDIALDALDDVLKSWKSEENYPVTFSYDYTLYNKEYYHVDIVDHWTLRLPESAVYIGNFLRCIRHLEDPYPEQELKKWDLWVMEIQGGSQWRLMCVSRINKFFSYTQFSIATANSKEALSRMLINYLCEMYWRFPIDFSIICENLNRTESLQEIRCELSNYVAIVEHLYGA